MERDEEMKEKRVQEETPFKNKGRKTQESAGKEREERYEGK